MIAMSNAASRPPSRRPLRLGLVAGLSLAAALLLADAGSAKSNNVSSAGGHVRSGVRRCDPPPCPAKAAVKSQQPPSVWSGSTKPTEGNKTNQGGPIH
jgi:hypothetical protein